jgi:hypothetical protein
MSRPQIIVVDASHWLEKDGELPYDGPKELFRNALRVAQCIEYGGPLPTRSWVPTLIPCRRRPGGKACRGTMIVLKTERDELYVACPACNSEEFLISNWQDTVWAEGVPEPVAIDQKPFARDDEPDDSASDLFASDGTLDADALRKRIATAESPSSVIEEILASLPPPTEAAARALTETVMTLWNSTPRPELGDRTPEEVFRASRPEPARSDKVGRNQSCPCGSGLKYKRCCGAH